jgi:hypothetical protein
MWPDAQRAFVEPAKLRDYLLSSSHPVGRFKAKVFFALGYTPENWQELQSGLLDIARTGQTHPGQPSPYGVKYEVSGILKGPNGREAAIVTAWIVANGEDFARFVTAYPR